MWCREVILSREQTEILAKSARDPYYGKRFDNIQKQKMARMEKIAKLAYEGEKEVGLLSKRELFLVGIALYWAEGYKKDSQAGLGSSDPGMILLFIKWLKTCFGYSDTDLLVRVTVNEAHEYRIKEITKFWSKLLQIDENQFKKPFYQHVKWKKVYENPEEYFGVLRVRVRKSSDFLRKIRGYIQGLKLNV